MNLLQTIVYDYLWGIPLVILILTTGIYLTLKTKFYQFRKFKHSIKTTFKNLKVDGEKGDGVISPFEALSVALGATIGVGNIGGVATAIAFGGPGAIFWLWIAGLLGPIIKMAEITLAVHYRSKDNKDEAYGGPTYYISRGLGKERKLKKLSKVLNFIFISGFATGFFLTVQNYTISEAISTTFNFNIVLVSGIFTILLYMIIAGGLSSLAKYAAKLVPFMVIFYMAGGLFIIFKNINMVPESIRIIFDSAFNGTAATGGFVGATVAKAIKVGMSRAVFSNEAGWGSSPMVHASARTDHPVKQGLLGVFEVFMDTIVILTITALVIMVTGEWSSGLDGAALTLSAFESGLGEVGRVILTIGIFLFGLTTVSGIYAQIEVLLRYMLGKKSKKKEKILTVYKWFYPLPGFLMVVIAAYYGMPGIQVWLFADMSTALPIFANVVALLLLSPKFLELLKDYNSRYIQKKNIDSSFNVFFEDKKESIKK
ncbi:alanine/glycine:cation symporter family protein [Dethiothermospora halolimnae]|uniref:alanine/glycine:cation symporter family protein n=1 Tax=Dethiothermospora halolimnae TaxID=3114390 RepID=UPI003CCBB621